MSSLIDDLLNLSRVASTPLQHVSVDLSALAKSILANLAQNSERRVETIVADGCVALADEGLISVVLENLLRNAWKYSSRKDPARIEFGCRDEGEETIFFVRDNGAGFDNITLTVCFVLSNACTHRRIFPEPASGWPPCKGLLLGTVGVFGRQEQWTKEQNSVLRCLTKKFAEDRLRNPRLN